MKKQLEKQPKRVIPAFATEAEEAEWWYKNRNLHGKQLLAAVKNGEAQVLTKEKLRERIAASKKMPAPTVALGGPVSQRVAPAWQTPPQSPTKRAWVLARRTRPPGEAAAMRSRRST